MNKDYFVYHGTKYYADTIVEVHENKREFFHYWSVVKFVRCDEAGLYCFSSLYDIWTLYKLSAAQIPAYISKILTPELSPPITDTKMDPKYIDGIVEAWTWYLLAMVAAPFIKDYTIVVWIFASVVFFTWRNNKINRK